MYKIVFLILFSFLYGIEIDSSIENNLSKNDIKNRLILSKYYYDKNLTKSEMFLNQVLKIDKNNKNGKKLLNKVKLKKEFLSYFKDKNIDKYYQNLYFNQNYKEIKKLSKFLNVIKSDYPKIITAKIYFWDGNYKKTKQILKLIQNKNLDYLEIEANLAWNDRNYLLAKKDFSILYDATYKLDYAYKLIDIYLFLNEVDKANRLIYLLLKKDKNNKKLIELKNRISSKKDKEIEKLLKIYEKTQKFEDLQKVVYILLNYDKNDKAYNLLEEYIKKNPYDNNAKYWYATYLSWGGDNKKALKILEKIVEDGDYRTKLLIAKIYSWNGDYEKSINYLNDIIANDKKLQFDAMEVKGLIYYWQHNYKKAKPILEEVLKHKNSIDVKESLMVINGNIKPLIQKYKLLSQKNPTNLDYILRVAQYSETIKDIDTAIKYYEKYYNLKQNPQVAHSLAKLYLLKKNPYKSFSYYEYWAYQKGDVDSLYELAKNYYYAGYSKSALSVINDILDIDKKYKKALQLKAKILQYSPKFTQENSNKSLNDIFEEKNSKLLTIANRLYFNGFYDDAINYYKQYLLNNTNDYEVRERYAYSLEFAGKYKEASGEFFLLTWQKKDCNILYHYGITLEKSKKDKLSKKVFKEALNYAKKPIPTFIETFIAKWKKGWESQNINKYKQFYTKKYQTNPVWLVRKENIFRKLKFISLYFAGFSVIDSFKKDDKTFYKVKFYQQYTTDKKSDKGYKILLLKCENEKCLIDKESWQKGEYLPTNYRCYNLVSNKLNNKQNNFNMKNLLKNHKSEFIFDKSIHKNLKNEDKVFTKFKVKKYKELKKKRVKKIIKKKNIVKIKTENKNKNFLNVIGLKGYYYEDKEKIKLIDYGIFYENPKLYFDISAWKLWQNKNSRKGNYFTFHYKIDNFVLGTEIGNYEKNSYFFPYLEYKGDLNLQYFHSITGKDKKSFCGVDNNLTTKHLVISKYKGFKSDYLELTNYWWSVDFSQIEDNQELTPQFQYNFYKDRYKNMEWFLYLSGWYQYNSKTTNCYYSPDLTDSTFLELHPVYKNIEGIGKIGYSFLGNSFLYSYGLNYTNKFLKIGCMKNHSYKDTISNYWYEECYLKAKVEF